MPSKKYQQNFWSFNPSEPFKNGHFNVRHPVFQLNLYYSLYLRQLSLMNTDCAALAFPAAIWWFFRANQEHIIVFYSGFANHICHQRFHKSTPDERHLLFFSRNIIRFRQNQSKQCYQKMFSLLYEKKFQSPHDSCHMQHIKNLNKRKWHFLKIMVTFKGSFLSEDDMAIYN